MKKAEVVTPIDDPKLLVARCGVENLLVWRQHDECREPNLGVYRHDIGFRIANRSCRRLGIDRGAPYQQTTVGQYQANRSGKCRGDVARLAVHGALLVAAARGPWKLACCGAVQGMLIGPCPRRGSPVPFQTRAREKRPPACGCRRDR